MLLLDFTDEWWLVKNCVFCLLKLVCLSGGMSTEGNNEVFGTKILLSKKKRSRVTYKGHLTKFEADIIKFLNDSEPRNLFHNLKAKLNKINILKKLDDEILEFEKLEE